MSHSRSTIRVIRTLDTPLGVASAAPAAARILLLHSPRTQRARFELTPDLKSETRNNPNEKTHFSGTELNDYQPPCQTPQGTSLPGNEDPGNPGREIRDDDREGAGTPRHACFIRMSCRGLYLNPGYQPSAHRIPTRSLGEPNPGRDKERPHIGLGDKYEHAPACSEGPAFPTDYGE